MKKMKKPLVDVVRFGETDVIATSGGAACGLGGILFQAAGGSSEFYGSIPYTGSVYIYNKDTSSWSEHVFEYGESHGFNKLVNYFEYPSYEFEAGQWYHSGDYYDWNNLWLNEVAVCPDPAAHGHSN